MKRFVLPLTAVMCIHLSSSARAADPAWWAARGVTTSSSQSNLSPATIGQAKHMIAMALAELQTRLDASAFQTLQADVAAVVDLAVPSTAGQFEEQRAILLVGQLKAIADPFYRHLDSLVQVWLANQRRGNGTQDLGNSTYIFPWSSSVADDSNKAMASIGQLKAVFALRFEVDSDANSLPDFWEYRFLGQLGNNGSTDSDGDGLTNLQEAQAGTDPNSIDSDQDGMPDIWEILHQFNPIDPADAVQDLDADGITNLEEFLAGTNPESTNVPLLGPAIESFGYDQADRLNAVTSPVSGTFGLDPEGNILNVQ